MLLVYYDIETSCITIINREKHFTVLSSLVEINEKYVSHIIDWLSSTNYYYKHEYLNVLWIQLFLIIDIHIYSDLHWHLYWHMHAYYREDMLTNCNIGPILWQAIGGKWKNINAFVFFRHTFFSVRLERFV